MAVQTSSDEFFATAVKTNDIAEFACLVVLLFFIMLTLPSATFIQAFDLDLADHAKYDEIIEKFSCHEGFRANGANTLRPSLHLHIDIRLHAGHTSAVTTRR